MSQPSESSYVYAGFAMNTSPVLVDANTVLFTFTGADSATPGNVTGNVQSIDMNQGLVNWTFQAAPGCFCTPALANGVVYAGMDDNALHAIDVHTGKEIWRVRVAGKIRTAPFVIGNLVVVGTMAGEIAAIDVSRGAIAWSHPLVPAQLDYTRVGRAAVAGSTVIVSCSVNNPSEVGATVYAFDLQSGRQLWTFDPGDAVTSNMAVGDGLVFFGVQGGIMHALDVNTGGSLWTVGTGGPIVGDPAYDSGWVYWGSQDGNFYAHMSRPQPLKTTEWVVAVSAEIPSGVLVHGDKAYFGALDAQGTGFFYVLDLKAAQKGRPVALTDQLQGQMMFLPAIADGRIAFALEGLFGGEIVSIDLGVLGAQPRPRSRNSSHRRPAQDTDGMLDQISFASTLMADDYDPGPSSATPRNPSFRMALTLKDDTGARRTSSSVSVWAADPITLTVNGQKQAIGTDPDAPLVVSADGSGQFTMVANGAIDLPNIYLQPDFFISGFYATVFPDFQVLNRLAGIQGSDLDPATAKGFNGTPVLNAPYQAAATREQIAATIRNGIGRQVQTSKTLRSVNRSGLTDRPFQKGDIPNWHVTVSDDSFSFNPLSSAEVRKYFGSIDGPGLFWLPGDSGGFADFIADIVNGAEQVAEVVWQWTEQGVGAIVHGVQKVYNFVVETVEQAVQVVKGILKRVAADIDKFVEWLSYIFDWSDIVATKKLIEQQVITAITRIKTWVDSEIGSAEKDIDAFFKSCEADVSALFDVAIQHTTGISVASIRATNGDPSTVLQPNGQDITPESRWLLDKIGASPSGAVRTAPGDTYTSLIQQFLSKIQQEIASDTALQRLPADAQKVFTDLVNSMSDSSTFSNTSLADVLTLVRDIALSILELADNLVDAFLQLIQAILDGVLAALTASISIPIVSDLYRSITGDELSCLSLGALMVAIPATIAAKILGLTRPSLAASDTDASQYLGLLWSFAVLGLIPVWVIADMAEFPDWILWPMIGMDAVYNGLSISLLMMSLQTLTPEDMFISAIQLGPLLLSLFVVESTDAEREMFLKVAPGMFGGYGLAMTILFSVAAGKWPDKYGHWSLASNILGSIPYLSQPALYIKTDDVGQAITVLADFFGYGFSAVTAIIDLQHSMGVSPAPAHFSR